ncbi:MAG: ATP-binding protein/SpoIIE family protein phosphatase [Halieaceae bacterium]|nr:ATP-binding protein/SpoIIE family protein phosphatase [Halieaceae bacterium]
MDTDEGATRLRVASEADATRTVVEAHRYCREAGLKEVDAQAVSTAVSELSRNILKYAGRGEITLQNAEHGSSRGVVVTARDRGPGIEDVETAMQDHFSSSGTLGLGLPGVRRMMDDFTITSKPGELTEVRCLKWDHPPLRATRILPGYRPCAKHATPQDCDDCQELDASQFSRPCQGERVNGDVAMIERRGHLLMTAVIDGLGHGPEANRVSSTARDFLQHRWSQDVVDTMRKLHDELRGSLGAVAGIAVIDSRSGQVNFSGIGNIAYRVFGQRNLRLMSAAGNLGHQIRSPRQEQHTLAEDEVIVIYSDGISDRFELQDYPQILYQSADTIARTVVERFGKAHDDATCIALRMRK